MDAIRVEILMGVKKMKRILSIALALILVLASVPGITTFADNGETYPELIITEISVDQYCDEGNRSTNPNYPSRADTDVFEFIEVYNNSTQKLNVFNYMVAYQGASSTNTAAFEQSVQCYSPVYPGADWWKADYSAYDVYWKNTTDKRPENPAYSEGEIASGELAVLWIYNAASHSVHANVEQFRKFWNVPDNVKVFLVDGNDVELSTNFTLKNTTTGTYMIMHQSERFPSRRASDKTYYCENDNTHHNYKGQTYADLDEVICWSVVDFRSEPLKTYAAQNGGQAAKTNYTISYVPEASSNREENGYKLNAFKSLKRTHLDAVNSYSEATVGKLNAAQTKAFASTQTKEKKAADIRQITADNGNERADLLITEISPDQKALGSKNVNSKYTGGSDPFEFYEFYNNSGHELNIFDYMMAYQGAAATSVSTYFERSIQEFTPFLPGADWFDAPYTTYDSYWKNSSVKVPVNPSYEEGVLKAGEVCVVWGYSADSHTINATIEDFRAFWSIPSDVKVFLIDGNSSRNRNFNIKNSDTGEYIIMQESERFLSRRSDDETYYIEADRSTYWYCEKTFYDMPEVVSWAVVDFGCYNPLYTFNQNGVTSNYTINFAPFDGEVKFENGFLTTTFATMKRARFFSLSRNYADSTVGTLSAEQKAAIEKSNTLK